MDSRTNNFIFVAREYKNNEFPYICPECLCHIGIKKRVTINKRVCPQCGTEITTQNIDRQASHLRECIENDGCLPILIDISKKIFKALFTKKSK